MTRRVRIGLAGAGAIGTRHAEAIGRAEGVALAAVADPAPVGRLLAEAHGAAFVSDVEALVGRPDVDAVLIATPNVLHVAGAEQAIAAGKPVLVEKPIATDADAARKLVDAAERAGVPVAVGHHRRHNPIVARAKALIDEGRLGTLVATHGTTWFYKPDDYFTAAWRREAGGGPVFLNLIHDVDLMAHFCGPIATVQATMASAVRGGAVEDTAAVLLRFASGVLGTLTVSDTAVAPWSWELTARENPAYPATGEDAYLLSGTHGSLAVPSLALWSQGEARSWMAPIGATRFPCAIADPLVRQAEQFARVVRGEEASLVSGRDGLAALRVVEAVKSAAATGATVALSEPSGGANVGAGRPINAAALPSEDRVC